MSVPERLQAIDPALLKPTISLSDTGNGDDEPEVVSHADIRSTDIRLTGGKTSSLGILDCVAGVNVPYYFCVTTHPFRRMVIHIKADILELQALSDGLNASHHDVALEKELEQKSEAIRLSILDFDLPESLVSSVKQAYDSMAALIGFEQNKLSVAVRSSATTEDLEDASFAGIHQTFLNQKGLDNILASIKKCWASAFGLQAVKYRMLKGIAHADAEVAVCVQKLVFPRAAGTSFNIEIGTGFPGLHVAASFGLGESLVSGEVTSDEWLLNPANMVVIKRVCGSKRIQYQILEDCSGIARVESDTSIGEPTQKRFSLTDDMVRLIAETTRRIGEAYRQLFGYAHIDTEFAVSATPTLYFLQARPVVPVVWERMMAVDKTRVRQKDILVTGKFSLLGSAHGRVHVITSFDKLASGEDTIQPDDIIVTFKTSNYWTQYLTALGGIITVEGSPTAHPMLLGRERQIPCVIGVDNAVDKLLPYQGQWITLGRSPAPRLFRAPTQRQRASIAALPQVSNHAT